jgi:predicted enzyme related to lactoylglutathione lyase
MITHLHSVAIFVSDRDRAVEFYREALGFEVTADVTDPANPENRWLTVKPKSGETSMMLLRRPPQNNEAAESLRAAHMIFSTNDIAGDCERIKANGGTIVSETKRAGWGDALEAHFADPDGNVYMLIEPGRRP